MTFIASLIESSDFFWDVSESRADYGVPIAEFFCGVILKRLSSDGAPIGDALSQEAACLGPRGNQDATIDSQKIRWNCCVSRPSIEPGDASAP
jgi:hypothetical protein